MKNTQSSPSTNMDQTIKNDNGQQSASQTQTDNSSAHLNKENVPGQQSNNTSSQSQNSNISVDNEGKIGKAHDLWENDNNNTGNNNPGSDKQVKSDKTKASPEIDAPIYEPEKTERKIPRMEEQSKNNKQI